MEISLSAELFYNNIISYYYYDNIIFLFSPEEWTKNIDDDGGLHAVLIEGGGSLHRVWLSDNLLAPSVLLDYLYDLW